ncbi:antitoxin [Streptomyces sp. PKU-EA00015]|uniref:antitoxin n=1 Tax=Streptomyces sp. PKU-EA00015 TaxID=2748326 RepID=UPI0015A4D2ED|nr:antitoxin [Streptomyces sp. PKU-EA00015]NWF27632.1 antitoxin [Streptomyces sp. PKU-EA00015]
MSMMDKIKSMLKGHPQQTNQGIEKAGDYVDDRTQGKHRRHVDTAQDRMREQLGGEGGRPGPAPGPDRGPDEPPRA